MTIEYPHSGQSINAASEHERLADLEQHANTHEQLTPPSSPPRLKFAKVVAMYDASGNSWTDYPTDSEYPAYCTANPCDSGGGNVDTGTTVYVGLNTKSDSPNGIITAANQTIGYMPTDGVKAYSGNTLSGQCCLGFGCWIDFARWRAGA